MTGSALHRGELRLEKFQSSRKEENSEQKLGEYGCELLIEKEGRTSSTHKTERKKEGSTCEDTTAQKRPRLRGDADGNQTQTLEKARPIQRQTKTEGSKSLNELPQVNGEREGDGSREICSVEKSAALNTG